jgi:hypothetical protein
VPFILPRTAPLVLEFRDIEMSSRAVYYGLPPRQERHLTSHLVGVFPSGVLYFASVLDACVGAWGSV